MDFTKIKQWIQIDIIKKKKKKKAEKWKEDKSWLNLCAIEYYSHTYGLHIFIYSKNVTII